MGTAEASLPPLVDRQEEVARLAEALDAAERGEGQLLLLRGEAGCGKTRLLQEAAAEAARRGFAVGFGTALAESVTPYHPWKEALQGLGLERILEERPPPKLLGLYVVGGKGDLVAKVEREGAGNGLPAAAAALRSFVKGSTPQDTTVQEDGTIAVFSSGNHRVVAQRGDGFQVGAIAEGEEGEGFLADLREVSETVHSCLGGAPKGRKLDGEVQTSVEASLRKLLESGKYEGIEYAKDDPKLRQARLFDHVALGLTRRAAAHPQLVTIDDLQWADPTSLALLQYVARNEKAAGVLLVGAYRVEEAGVRPHLKEALARMEQERLPAGILVSGLPREDMRRLAAVFLGPHAIPGEFLELLWRETQGYPLFVREVLRGLEAEGTIRLRGAAKRLERPAEELAIPHRVRQAVRARLEKLPREDRRLLDAAAACGSRFTTALLARVLGEREEKVLPDLNNLARVHGLVRPVKNRFAFDHPVVREVVYEEMPEEIRRAYHRAAAEWLELVGGNAEDIADHFYRAKDARSVPRLQLAADMALKRFANDEAVRMLAEAAEMASPDEMTAVLERQGDALEAGARYEEAVNVFRLAQKAGAQRDRCCRKSANAFVFWGKDTEALEACDEGLASATDAERPHLLSTKAKGLLRQGSFHAAAHAAEIALETFGRGDHLADWASAMITLGSCHLRQGRVADAEHAYTMALATYENLGDRRGIARATLALSQAYRTSDKTKARDASLRALTLAESIGDRYAEANALIELGISCVEHGELDRALEFYSRSLALSRRVGNQSIMANCLALMAIVQRSTGHANKALENLKSAISLFELFGQREMVASTMVNIGITYIAEGEADRAVEILKRALALSRELGSVQVEAEAQCFLGRTLCERHSDDEGLSFLEQGFARARELHDVELLASALGPLVAALLRRNRPDQAVQMAEEMLEISLGEGARILELAAILAQAACDVHESRVADARVKFRQAAEGFSKMGAVPMVADTYFEWGLAEKTSGDPGQARECLSKAAESYEILKLSKRAVEARRVLRSLS